MVESKESNNPNKTRRTTHTEMLHERQTARGLLTHAKEYFRAGSLIADQVGTSELTNGLKDSGYHNPFYYLCGHSLELSMKASLLSAGQSHKYLKGLGHELMKSLAAMRMFFPSHVATYDEHLDIIELLDCSYAAKEFEYRITGAKSWPRVSPLLYVVDEFCILAEKIISEADK